MTYLNYAFYKFATIDDPEHVRSCLLQASADTQDLRGTVLIAHEGLNCYFAGREEEVEALLKAVQKLPGFETVQPKVSISTFNPFRKLVIKCRSETIGLGVPDIDPNRRTGKYLKPSELKRWLDEQRNDLILVDTRNNYEVELGTFAGAINPQIQTFKDFPQWVEENLADCKDKKIVTFCTGGIRCEKATAHMLDQGFQDVYQVEGGILQYLEDTMDTAASNHWEGDCFVFDYRVALGKDLKPTDKRICYACWAVLTPQDLDHPQFKEGESCPKCFDNQQKKKAKQKRAAERKKQDLLIRRRKHREFIRSQRLAGEPAAVSPPPPGSIPDAMPENQG